MYKVLVQYLWCLKCARRVGERRAPRVAPDEELVRRVRVVGAVAARRAGADLWRARVRRLRAEELRVGRVANRLPEFVARAERVR